MKFEDVILTYENKIFELLGLHKDESSNVVDTDLTYNVKEDHSA